MKTFGKAVVFGFGFHLGKGLYCATVKYIDRLLSENCEVYRKISQKHANEKEVEIEEVNESRPVMGFRG